MKKLLIGLIVLFGAQAMGKEVAGKVVAIEGQVTVKPKGKKTKKLQRGSTIFTQEMIQVSGSSRVQVRFTDGSILNLIPNTKYQIQAYNYTEDKTDNQYLGQIFTGGFRHLTGKIAKENPENVKIRTPTATIGVRGTIFEVLLSGSSMTVGCVFGQISVANAVGSVDLGPSAPFQFSVVTAESVPQGLVSRPPDFGEKIFAPPAEGLQMQPQDSPEAIAPKRIKGGC